MARHPQLSLGFHGCRALERGGEFGGEGPKPLNPNQRILCFGGLGELGAEGLTVVPFGFCFLQAVEGAAVFAAPTEEA